MLIVKIVLQSLVSVMLTLIIVLVSIWSYNEANKELVTSYSRYMFNVTKNKANYIEDEFQKLASLFDYVNENLKREGMINAALTGDYFKRSYSTIAEDFLIFSENGDILYRGEKLFLEDAQLRSIFLETLEDEKGLPTPRISEYKKIKIHNDTLGIFLYFEQLLFSTNRQKLFLTFIISGERIYNNYIKNLQLDSKSNAYLIDDDHIIVTSNEKEHIGKNLYRFEEEKINKILEENKDVRPSHLKKLEKNLERHKKEKYEIFSKMSSGEAGTEQYVVEQGGKIELLSFHPIIIPGDTWSLAINTPYDYVTRTLRGSFIRTIVLSALFILILFLDFAYVIYNYKKRVVAEFELDHLADLLEKEQEIRKTEYRYKQLYQGTREFILICDESFVIEEINQAGVNFIGKNIKNILHKLKFSDRFINSGDLDNFNSLIKKSKSVTMFQTEVKRGEEFRHLEINADKYLDEREKKEYIYFVIRDITEGMKLQEEIINKKRLESAMALVVTANHEINNPLTSISLNLDLIKSISNDEKINDCTDNISKNVFRISNVLQKLRKIEDIKETEYSGDVRMIDFNNDEKDE